MKRDKAINVGYQVLKSYDSTKEVYPYLRNEDGDKEIYCLSPYHGRSFIVGRLDNGRYVVSKGNGLSYTRHSFLHTTESYDDTWGLLLRQDAERDFAIGQEIEALGLKTNHMEYVLELNYEIRLPSGRIVKPILLQYDVECPCRISDATFMTKDQIQAEVQKWGKMNERGYNTAHMIAANVLIRNLRIMHDRQVLHNAIHEQNYTWALELLDFEIACTPTHPYSSEDDMRHVKDLFSREMIHTYVIINYIAGALREDIDYAAVDALFKDYGFNLHQYDVSQKDCKEID